MLRKDLVLKSIVISFLIWLVPYLIQKTYYFIIVGAIVYVFLTISSYMNRVGYDRVVVQWGMNLLKDKVNVKELFGKIPFISGLNMLPFNHSKMSIKDLKKYFRGNNMKMPKNGTGKNGRVIKYDLIKALENGFK